MPIITTRRYANAVEINTMARCLSVRQSHTSRDVLSKRLDHCQATHRSSTGL